MAFLPENPLEVMLMRASTDPASRPEFYRLLLESDLYVFGPPGASVVEGTRTFETGETIALAKVPFKDRMYHPIFTSLSRLENFIEGNATYYGINGLTLFELTRGAYFLLNPGSDYGKELLPGEIADLLEPAGAKQTITIEEETRVMVGQPAVYPQALVDALRAMFVRRTEVLSAHLIQIAFEGKDEAPHPLLGIETTGDWQQLSQELGRVLKTVNPAEVVDVIAIDRNDQSGVMRALLESPAFYSRELPTI